jgi:hypothetical protein
LINTSVLAAPRPRKSQWLHRTVVQNESRKCQVDLLSARGSGFLQDFAGIHQADFARHLPGNNLQWRDAAVGITLQARSRHDQFFHALVGFSHLFVLRRDWYFVGGDCITGGSDSACGVLLFLSECCRNSKQQHWNHQGQ